MDLSANPSELAHDERANALITVVCIVCTVATVSVGLRFYTRSCILKQLGADDYLIFIAWAFALATGISQSMNTRNGLGRHVWDLGSVVELRNYLKGFYVSIILYNTGLLFVKLAFLTQYYRVFSLKNMRLTFIAAMIIIGCWSLSQIIVAIFICDPVDGFWKQSADSKCIPNYPQWYINAAGNITTDIVIFVLPLPILRHLHMPRAQRLVLIGIFSLGFFTCAISVIRVKFLKQGGDFSYENVEGSSWSTTELCSGVTCACLPTLRPLISKWIPSLSNRLHKPMKSYKRHSDSCRAAVQKASRHMRLGSGASNNLDMKSEEELFYCIGVEAHASNSADGSEDLSDMKEHERKLSGREQTSPTPPPCARVASHKYYNWMESSVTTEIGTEGGSKRLSSNPNLSATVIQVRHDVVVHKI
ncbi:uncharacterized protein GGS22DRAFT_150402 [Annulohypoxylon maeteangense]|uniref:uncharacterized protein n=1 Tax=Annulohypoxylon maeteangense TaxID=1927788 RepID=UPI002007B88D|nr:uncharacterized protein GGS22DRAFT_150402 [Annulohypoxylon maeteangense]KAI0890244.1 hypothetical protein GGS22DRAFT_150402 [Annulohypoxylon maeteangense]